MARPREFKVAAIAELFRQILYASDDARLRQMTAAEQLVHDIDPEQNYPEAFITYRVTGYRPDSESDSVVVGRALIGDLVTFIQRLSSTLSLAANHNNRHALSLDEVACRLGVTTRTVQRYRRQGLVCHEVTVNNNRQLVCFEDSLDAFARRHEASLDGEQSATRIAPETRKAIVEAAREMRSQLGLTLHATARKLALEHSRAVETIRGILQRHDRDADIPIFAERGPITEREQRIIARAYRRGIEPAELAARFHRAPKTIHRALLHQRVSFLQSLAIDAITLPTFDLPGASDVLLSADVVRTHLREPAPTTDAVSMIKQIKAEEPIQRHDEAALIGAYNFLKCRAKRDIDTLNATPRVEAADAIETDLRWAALLKRVLVCRAMPVGITTIERNLGRALLLQSADEICRFLPLAVQVMCESIEKIDPSRGQVIERVCTFAMDRCMARLRFTPAAHRAAAKHRVRDLPIDDLLRDLSPWQSHLDLSPSLAGRVHRLESADSDLVICRYGLDGRPPQSLMMLASAQQTTTAGISRRLRRAELELKHLAARDQRRAFDGGHSSP